MGVTDHKSLALVYGVTAGAFLLLGFLLMLLLRWQLAWPAADFHCDGDFRRDQRPAAALLPDPLPARGHARVGDDFLAVVPLATGAFGGYLVPLQLARRGWRSRG